MPALSLMAAKKLLEDEPKANPLPKNLWRLTNDVTDAETEEASTPTPWELLAYTLISHLRTIRYVPAVRLTVRDDVDVTLREVADVEFCELAVATFTQVLPDCFCTSRKADTVFV